MFEYTFDPNEDIKILTSFDAKQMNKVVTLSGEVTHNLLTYSNGFIVEMIEYPDKIILKSNRELIDNGDGTMDVLNHDLQQ